MIVLLYLIKFLTEYIMATNATPGLSFQALKFVSANNKQTGADIIVPHKLYNNAKTSSAGYVFMIWVCDNMLQSS